MADLIAIAATRLGLPLHQVKATAALLEAGATVPFISRYRKEVTGNLDEVAVRDIEIEIDRLKRLDARRTAIIESIEEQGKLTPELSAQLDAAETLAALEDIYLPYRPKRRTRATAAREAGLEPLARMIMGGADPDAVAPRFVKGEVADRAAALAGASDIIAEWADESPRLRNCLRRRFRNEGRFAAKPVKGKEHEADKYRAYFNFSAPLRSIPSHQYLALRRAEAEGLLRVSVTLDDSRVVAELAERFMPAKVSRSGADLVKGAVADAYKRLLRPSIETEMAAETKERADAAAIAIFSDNLRQLLMAPPLRGKRVLAIDPGYRTGCKIAALDADGTLMADGVIYPNEPRRDTVGAMRTVMEMIDEYDIEAVALGDRTASRETEQFLRNAGVGDFAEIHVVSENGASVYSASDLARKEMPDKDVTVRGAVSIGRRLIDPLAELVKIDPKSIGVGQYQHDVDARQLRDALDFTVVSCVNAVGVDLNTASPSLLGYISGIGPAMAARIVEHRTAHGPFTSRCSLLDVPRLGAKIFEQAAGFLRVPCSTNPLDNTGIHPESYKIVERMAADVGVEVGALISNGAVIDSIDIERYAHAGAATVADIVAELRKPGRDPRTETANAEFDPSVATIDDVKEGMILTGKVGNITAFGAFIDLGIKENGLLHVSQMGEKRVTDPSKIVKINTVIKVKVIAVDYERRRISLSIKGLQ